MNWEIYPQGLYDLLIQIKSDYKDIPIYITENGASFDDVLTKEGKVHDAKRIDYLREHIKKVWEAQHNGVNIKGYFVWSLFDNLEWAFGYTKKFGIIYVDFSTLKRYQKDSAYFFHTIIKNNGILN